jgi:hypothetical protein
MKGSFFKILTCAAWSLEDVDLLLANAFKLACKSPKCKKQLTTLCQIWAGTDLGWLAL